MGAKNYGVKMSGGRKLTYTLRFAETHDLRVVVPCGVLCNRVPFVLGGR